LGNNPAIEVFKKTMSIVIVKILNGKFMARREAVLWFKQAEMVLKST